MHAATHCFCIYKNTLTGTVIVDTKIRVNITFDPTKRDRTLAERGLDFADAAQVFAGLTFTMKDDRFDYREERFISAGMLADRMVVIVWTPTEDGRRIISMRKANEREQQRFRAALG
ncbi:BrnT family toxin [Niveispirillum irakense]|uniref:BrnT family toxin n=1 Tax=Niveispirillum irakense TaxID=34011 RepID=UPI001FE05AA7|nr:BrnT family toxin [Niveispirillum irakense]